MTNASQPQPRHLLMDEQVWENITANTARMRVPGGWIIREFTIQDADSPACAVGLVFFPDANHTWVIG
jgi:hypothetical protein